MAERKIGAKEAALAALRERRGSNYYSKRTPDILPVMPAADTPAILKKIKTSTEVVEAMKPKRRGKKMKAKRVGKGRSKRR